jgi:plastocyanin
MKKQQIILIAVAVIIFVGLIYLGVKQTPKSQPSVNSQPIESISPSVSNNEGGETPVAPNPGSSEQSEAPKSAIEVAITDQGITPASFAVKAGQEIALSVSSADQDSHFFKFESEKLATVLVRIGPGDTRVLNFSAPAEKGEYEYYCDMPGHIERGEKGTMIVK